jgi:toxin CcdB
VVQSSLFDTYRRRMVVPLVRRTALGSSVVAAGTRLNPGFEVKGALVVLHPLDMVSGALDELLTRSWS